MVSKDMNQALLMTSSKISRVLKTNPELVSGLAM